MTPRLAAQVFFLGSDRAFRKLMAIDLCASDRHLLNHLMHFYRVLPMQRLECVVTRQRPNIHCGRYRLCCHRTTGRASLRSPRDHQVCGGQRFCPGLSNVRIMRHQISSYLLAAASDLVGFQPRGRSVDLPTFVPPVPQACTIVSRQLRSVKHKCRRKPQAPLTNSDHTLRT